ncbi:hypothetical protein PIB30_044302 [Stylosanthes scabra]|uniref:Uncharacterized protein n=1 Tax=Stylosanthes scabra TaxID=79078 RepID=A0ABU6VF57_9FABA|nr:hypothetical protein [Stylosanthes scabra]
MDRPTKIGRFSGVGLAGFLFGGFQNSNPIRLFGGFGDRPDKFCPFCHSWISSTAIPPHRLPRRWSRRPPLPIFHLTHAIAALQIPSEPPPDVRQVLEPLMHTNPVDLRLCKEIDYNWSLKRASKNTLISSTCCFSHRDH